MLELDEPNKFNWKIEYHLEDQIIISGEHYDFIPKRQDIVILDNKIYSVSLVAYDFDTSVIRIELGFLRDVFSNESDD